MVHLVASMVHALHCMYCTTMHHVRSNYYFEFVSLSGRVTSMEWLQRPTNCARQLGCSESFVSEDSKYCSTHTVCKYQFNRTIYVHDNIMYDIYSIYSDI